jgi:hypothetical protein
MLVVVMMPAGSKLKTERCAERGGRKRFYDKKMHVLSPIWQLVIARLQDHGIRLCRPTGDRRQDTKSGRQDTTVIVRLDMLASCIA